MTPRVPCAVCRLLQKQRLKHMNSIVIRDGLRNEMAKQTRLEEEMREKREQQKMDMSKLNLMINQGEEQMVKLRKRYEKNVQHRNDRWAGIGLLGSGLHCIGLDFIRLHSIKLDYTAVHFITLH